MFVLTIEAKRSPTAALTPTETTRWVRLGLFVTVAIIIDILYMAYHVASHLRVMFSEYPVNFINATTYTTRFATFFVLRVIVLVRRRLFRELLWKLLSGEMNPSEERPSLRKRIKRCWSVFAVCSVFVVAFVVSECVVILRSKILLEELVYSFTFGAGHAFDRYYGGLILIVEHVFSCSLKLNNLGLSFLAFVFIQTLNDRVQRFGRKIGSIETPLSQDDVVALKDSFRGIRDAVAKLDDAYGAIFLFWYMDALLSAFKGIKRFSRGSLGVFGPFYALFNYFQAPVAVLILTFAASNIPINLRQARSDLREAISRSSFDHFPAELSILLKRMNPDNANLTAAGFFVITRSVCLSFMGFLITYLIVLMSTEHS